jgi:glutamine phosphoribosylpyrophosphate amidotransferase
MTWIETTSRNVSAALRETSNAQAALMVHLRLAHPVDWNSLIAVDHRMLNDLIAAAEHLGTVQAALNERLFPTGEKS